MNEGDIVLTPLPQADGIIKNRPALFLRVMPPFADALVCGISTQLHQQVAGFDEIISHQDGDYRASGLIFDSIVRLGFLAVMPQSRLLGRHWIDFRGTAQTIAGAPEPLSGGDLRHPVRQTCALVPTYAPLYNL